MKAPNAIQIPLEVVSLNARVKADFTMPTYHGSVKPVYQVHPIAFLTLWRIRKTIETPHVATLIWEYYDMQNAC